MSELFNLISGERGGLGRVVMGERRAELGYPEA